MFGMNFGQITVHSINEGEVAKEAAEIVSNILKAAHARGRTNFSREYGIHRVVWTPESENEDRRHTCWAVVN